MKAAPEQKSVAWTTERKILLVWLPLLTCVVYFFSNPKPNGFYDYTFRIATALLHGHVGLFEKPPSWLNEMVPFGAEYYSVFPLGAVLTMLPVALLKELGVSAGFPANVIGALTAGAIALLLGLLALAYELTAWRRVLLVCFVVFGTWMWCNLMFAGAWQLALGFAVLGETGALYFTLVKRQSLLAGLFFALGFGNRTEILLLAPVFIYLMCAESAVTAMAALSFAGLRGELIKRWPAIVKFLICPFVLGVLTLAYNYARFGSISDFGYARIPGVLDEPWYKHGIFSVYAIPLNFKAMLIEPWKRLAQYPYFVPTGFGGSILLSSPYLFFLFRRGAREPRIKIAAWVAIAILTLLLWCHGNPGGWQFSYRYAMILLPWIFLILLENSPKKVSIVETILIAASIAINLYATYLFLWTDYVQP